MPADAQSFHGILEARLPAWALPQADELSRYLALVAEYSRALNLTALSGAAARADGLVLEALRLLELGALVRDGAVCDLGSGNGSPLIPLALCLPEAQFTAVESHRKRAVFLRQVVSQLQIENVEVYAGRAETLATERPQEFDVVTARAFAPVREFLTLAAALTRHGGEIRGFCGADIAAVEDAAGELGLGVVRSIAYSHGEGQRHVYVVRTD